jgi:predicted phosphodiesterase
MTTLAILADIHGNMPALEAVIQDLRQVAVDHVVVAGDCINWGPFSQEVVERVTREGWAVIRGNNEFYLLDYETRRAPPAWNTLSDFPVLPWLHDQLHGRWQNTIAAWADTLQLRHADAPPIRVVHGSPRSAWEAMHPTDTDETLAPMLAGVSESVLIAAHTHLAMDRRVNSTRILNPGAVGLPLDGQVALARYMLLDPVDDQWYATFCSVPFDLARVLDELARQRFVERCGVVGQLIVEEFQTARLRLYPFLQWRARHLPGAPLTPDLLARFTEVDASDYRPPAYRQFD